MKLVGVASREGRKQGGRDGHGYIKEWDERVIRTERCSATVDFYCSRLWGGSRC